MTTIDEPVPDTGRAWMQVGAGQGYAMLYECLEKHHDDFGRAFATGTEAAVRVTWKHMGVAYRRRTEFNDWCQRVFERFDLLLCPVLPTEAFPAKGPMPSEINGQPLKHPLNAVVFTYPFNMSGHPGASVRAGLTDSGMPCGMQIVAERHREDLVLQASYAYEQARPWNQQVASDLIHRRSESRAAREMLPLIRAHADETERERKLAAPVVDAMRAGGLFSMGVPAALGGLETPLAQVLQTIEEVSYADGASGWNIMIAFDGGLMAAHLSAARARLLVASIPRAIIAGAVAASGQMVAADGGYRLTGRWPFGSGCQQADVFIRRRDAIRKRRAGDGRQRNSRR